MASIRRVGNSWRAETYRLGRRKSKNFSSRALAEDWAARDERRVSGMPVLEVWKGRTTFVLKRSMATGYAGVENPLFFKENTYMLFGDARDTLTALIKAL